MQTRNFPAVGSRKFDCWTSACSVALVTLHTAATYLNHPQKIKVTGASEPCFDEVVEAIQSLFDFNHVHIVKTRLRCKILRTERGRPSPEQLGGECMGTACGQAIL